MSNIRPVLDIPRSSFENALEISGAFGLLFMFWVIINGTVIIGPANIEPIAGTHVLQDFRLVLDMVHHTVRRARAMKAKSSRENFRDE